MNSSESHIQIPKQLAKKQQKKEFSTLESMTTNALWSAHAEVLTIDASYYINKLCKHFKHKVPASWDKQQGLITFAMGECHLSASEQTLQMHCEAKTDNKLNEIIETMQSHFLRFSRGDIPGLTWQIINGKTSK